MVYGIVLSVDAKGFALLWISKCIENAFIEALIGRSGRKRLTRTGFWKFGMRPKRSRGDSSSKASGRRRRSPAAAANPATKKLGGLRGPPP